MKQFSKGSQEETEILHPEDFPLGSPASRAAARAALKQRASTKEIITVLVTDVSREGASPEASANYPPPRCASREQGKDGFLVNVVHDPDPAWSDEQLQSFIDRHPITRD